TVANNITGGGRLRQVGGNVLTLTGSNSYSGGTNIAKGTLKVGSANALPFQQGVNLGDASNNAGVLDLAGFSVTINSLTTTGNGANTVTNSVAAPATITYAGGSGSFGGVIQDGAG